MPESLRQLWTGLRVLLVLTVLLGIAYPAATWAIGRLVFPSQSAGSMIMVSDQARGSRLIGQQFPGEGWFQPRASANDYDAQSSGGSNLGPNSADLVEAITQRRADIAAREGVGPAQVPADAVTASGSGLDAFISPEYARIQVNRVAGQRGLTVEAVRALVAEHIDGRTLGFLGQPRVNVVELNAALLLRASGR